jgi:hypothetical protein
MVRQSTSICNTRSEPDDYAVGRPLGGCGRTGHGERITGQLEGALPHRLHGRRPAVSPGSRGIWPFGPDRDMPKQELDPIEFTSGVRLRRQRDSIGLWR